MRGQMRVDEVIVINSFFPQPAAYFMQKIKQSEVEGAAEVEADPDLTVDLPIDQVKQHHIQPVWNELFTIQFFNNLVCLSDIGFRSGS